MNYNVSQVRPTSIPVVARTFPHPLTYIHTGWRQLRQPFILYLNDASMTTALINCFCPSWFFLSLNEFILHDFHRFPATDIEEIVCGRTSVAIAGTILGYILLRTIHQQKMDVLTLAYRQFRELRRTVWSLEANQRLVWAQIIARSLAWPIDIWTDWTKSINAWVIDWLIDSID